MRSTISQLKSSKNKFSKYNFNVQFAFTCKGKDYYTFTDEANIPVGRWLGISLQNLIHRSRIDPEYINVVHEAICTNLDDLHKKAISGDDFSKNLNEIKMIMADVKVRSDQVFNIEYALREASILFFTEDEDLYSYDLELNQAKMLEFAQSGLSSFFLQKPLRKLIPYTQISQEDLKIILQAASTDLKLTLRTVLGNRYQGLYQTTTDKYYQQLLQTL